MRRTDNGVTPRPARPYRLPEDGPRPDLPLYERLIDDGIAAADAHGSAVDHLTARRLAIWLAARPQQPSFAQGLARFINTGAIQRDLRNQLRLHARSASYADHAQAARLLRYCVDRDADPGPVGASFGAACHQMDRSDLMLAGTRDRTWHGTGRRAEQAEQEIGRPRPWPTMTRKARPSPSCWTPSPRTSPCTRSPLMPKNAKPTSAKFSSTPRTCPKAPMAAATARPSPTAKPRITTRLRAIRQAYQAAIEHDSEATASEPPGPLLLAERAADRERDLEIGQ